MKHGYIIFISMRTINMHLLEKDDIIDSREVYRLIHALCLLSQGDFNFSNKEALRNDE